MRIARFLASVVLAFKVIPTHAAADIPAIDRPISSQQALQVVRQLVSRFCDKRHECPVGVVKSTPECPYLFIAVVPAPENAAGERSIAIWVSLDNRGHIAGLSETREGACARA